MANKGRAATGAPAAGAPLYLVGSTMLRSTRLALGQAPVITVLEAHGHAVASLLEAADIPCFALGACRT